MKTHTLPVGCHVSEILVESPVSVCGYQRPLKVAKEIALKPPQMFPYLF